MLLQGFAEPGPGDEAQGVVGVDPAGFSVGSCAQLEDGDDAAEVVVGGVWWLLAEIHIFSVQMEHRRKQGEADCESPRSLVQSSPLPLVHPGRG